MAGPKADKVRFQLEEGELVLADVTSPLSSLIFPLLELVLVTGVAWIAIGWMDVTPAVGVAARNALVGVWALLVLWRFVLPVVRARRRRLVVTDRRVLVRGPRGAVDSIPHRQIHSARRAKGGLDIAVHGFGRPLHYESVGKAKQVERLINGRR